MMVLVSLLALLLAAFPAHAATSLTAWTTDGNAKVGPRDAAGTDTALSIRSAKLSYGSGQIIARCTDTAGSATCTGVDVTLPDLVMTGGPTLTISATTNATPVAVTFTANHNLSSQGQIKISGTGIGALDGNVYYVTVTSATAVTLNGTTAPGSTSATGTAQYAIHKNNITGYRGDTMYVFTPSSPPTLATTGEFPWRLIPGYVGADKKDPYQMETRTVFPISVATISPVFREWWPTPNVQHATNALNVHNLLTNGELGHNLTGWTSSTTGTGSSPAFAITGTDGSVSLPGGAAGTSKIEQCITTQAGWWYTLYYARVNGTVSMQVGSSSGASDLLAKTSAAASAQADFAGADGTACVQIFGENNTAQAKRIVLARARTRDWSLYANPTSSGWTDVSSGGTVTHSTGSNGQVTFNGTGGTAALETTFTVEANTTYVLYASGTGLQFSVGTTSGGTDIKTLTTVANESYISFSTGATSGTAYLRVQNSAASSITASNIYVTTPLSTGRITTSGTYTSTATKQYIIEITRSGGAATVPVGQFQWSDDNGATWSANTNIAASVVLSNGISAVFTGDHNDGERVTWIAAPVRNQPIWLDIYADSAIHAGIYSGTAVLVGASPVASINVPITFEVLPITIPAENTYVRTLWGLAETALPTVHGLAAGTLSDLHILYCKAGLRNHLTVGANLSRYPAWSWHATTGAISSMTTSFTNVNKIGKTCMDGVDTYATLGMYTTPKGAAWSVFPYPNQPSGVNQPTSLSSTAYNTGSLNLTKHLNAINDATYGWTAKVLQCDAVCDATYGHNDWSTNLDRLLFYGIDEPSLNTSLGSAESSSGEAMRELHDNLIATFAAGAKLLTTKEVLRAGTGDEALRGRIDIWFPIGTNTTRGIGKPSGSFATTGVYATRQDYLDSGASDIGFYDACSVNGCTAGNGTLDIAPYSPYVNSANAGETGQAFSDGVPHITVDEDQAVTRLWFWMAWHWGRPNYLLYYASTDSLTDGYGCYNGSGGYSGSRGQKNTGDCLAYDETAHMFQGAGDASYFFPGTAAQWGGTNPFVIESYQLKALRDSIRDMTLLHMAYAQSVDGGTELLSIVERAMENSNKMRARSNPAYVRSMVRDLENLAARDAGYNRTRGGTSRIGTSPYPRAQ